MNGTEIVSKSEYARRKGWDRAAVNMAGDRLVITEDGKVDVEASDRRYAATASASGASMTALHARNRATKKAGASAGHGGARMPGATEDTYEALAKSRAQVEAHKAALLKMEREEREGKLVTAASVRREAAKAAREARVALQSIAARIGPLLAAEPDVSRCILMIDAEIRRVCERLAT
jgi:hypothetical protein